MKNVFIGTIETIKEETNDENETTYFIKGEVSMDGEKWKDCIFIWSDSAEIVQW